MGNDNRLPISDFLHDLKGVLLLAVSSDYADRIIENFEFFRFVYEDVEASSGWFDEGYYNEDDIRLAIGRFLCKKLGLDY